MSTDPASIPAPQNPPSTGATGGTSQQRRTLAQVLAEEPHLAGEIDARTQRIATKEKDQGKAAGLAEFARSLGVDDPQVIAETFRRAQEQQTAQMTEAEKIKAEAEKTKAQAAAALQEAKQARFDAIAIKHLSKANAEAPEVMAAGLARFGVTPDSSEEEIAKAVEEMAKVMPGSFAAKATGTPSANPGQPPSGTPQGGKTGQDTVGGMASRQLERRANRGSGRAPIPGM